MTTEPFRDSDSVDPVVVGQDVGRRAYEDLARAGYPEEFIRGWLYGFLNGFMEPPARATVEQQGAARSAPPAELAASEPSASFSARVHDCRVFGAPNQAECRAISLNVEGMAIEYQPGDEIALLPSNNPEVVRDVLRALRLNPQTHVRMRAGSAPVWQILLERVNLDSLPRVLYDLMASYADVQDARVSLAALASSSNGCTRSLLALLRRFPRVRPPLAELLDALDPLVPTVVPIASVCSGSHRLEVLARSDSQRAYGTLAAVLLPRCSKGSWLTFAVRAGRRVRTQFEPLAPVVFVCDQLGAAVVHAHVAKRAMDSHRGRNWILGLDAWGAAGPYAEDAARWMASGHCRAVDRLASDACDFEQAFAGIEESLWRWLVDKSQIFLAITDEKLLDRFCARLRLLVATRGHLDEKATRARMDALEEEGRLLYWHHT